MTKNKRDQVSKDIGKLEEELSGLKNQLARALADYQNLEKRVVSEKEAWVKYAGAEILAQFLPVLDTLKLALKSLPAESQEGLALAIKQFENVFASLGVTPVVTLGQRFEPTAMECIETVVGEPDGQVAEEVTGGYFYHERLLRPARVKVFKKEDLSNSNSEQTNQ